MLCPTAPELTQPLCKRKHSAVVGITGWREFDRPRQLVRLGGMARCADPSNVSFRFGSHINQKPTHEFEALR